MISPAELSVANATVSLRTAGWHDVHKVWRWNSAPEVRALALQSQPIAVDEHQTWYSARLCETGHYMWIVSAGSSDVGVVRINATESDIGIVSIALARDARGRGIGTRALTAACRRIDALRPGQILEAWVAATNLASAHCFENCGFRWIRSEERGERTFNVYRWEAR